jgi:hypothetical protein
MQHARIPYVSAYLHNLEPSQVSERIGSTRDGGLYGIFDGFF